MTFDSQRIGNPPSSLNLDGVPLAIVDRERSHVITLAFRQGSYGGGIEAAAQEHDR
jgi:hypothetical protein